MKPTVAVGLLLTGCLTLAMLISAGWFGIAGESAKGPAEPPARPLAFNPLWRVFDANGDGELSEQEIQDATAKLRGFDANKDGKLTAEELRAALPPMTAGAIGSEAPGKPGGPGGAGVPAGPGGPGGARQPGRGPSALSTSPDLFNAPMLPKDELEKKLLAALDEMRKGPRYANVPTIDGRLLRLLTEAVDAKRVVEIGTSTGESGVWFAMALKRTGGHLWTHEIDPNRAKIAAANFKKAGVADIITIIEGDAHETVKQHKDPIDVLFLDADKEGYIDYLNKLLPLVRPGGLIIAHNMNVRMAHRPFVEAITTNPELETAFLYMEGSGISVTLKKR